MGGVVAGWQFEEIARGAGDNLNKLENSFGTFGVPEFGNTMINGTSIEGPQKLG